MRPWRLGCIAGVDLWILDLAPSGHVRRAQRAILSSEERAWADARVRPDVRKAAIAARAGLRAVLAKYRSSDPAALLIRREPDGKPWLEGGPHFNLSHAGDLAICAVSEEHATGVDLERITPVHDPDGLAARVLGPRELAWYRADHSASADERFLRCWTRREAYLKALGIGLPGLDQAGDPDPSEWIVRDLEPAPGYVGALVIDRSGNGRSAERPRLTAAR